jgi:homoserine dehydrogenase
MADPLRIAIAGLGTVGASTAALLRRNASILAQRTGRRLELMAVSSRDRAKDRELDLSGIAWADNAMDLVTMPGIDVVVEAIGGSDGIARELVEAALANGRHVVTANKALIARHGTALAASAEAAGVALAFEAAVAGGIPVLKAVREGLAANRLYQVQGILNGTSNFILTEMRATGRAFPDVLAEAQRLGYAEADPSFDVDGIDTAHKLAILAALAFGRQVDFASVTVEGIRTIDPVDIAFADQLGYRIKLLGIARQTEHGIEQRVHPCMVPANAPIAAAEGVFNAVVISGDAVEKVLLVGRGAGGGPTASAIVADIVDIALGRISPAFGVPASLLEPPEPADMGSRIGAYYLRLKVQDRPGVVADISAILRDEQISLESVLQRARSPGLPVPLVITTHDAEERRMRAAVAQIAALDSVTETPCLIRIEGG